MATPTTAHATMATRPARATREFPRTGSRGRFTLLLGADDNSALAASPVYPGALVPIRAPVFGLGETVPESLPVDCRHAPHRARAACPRGRLPGGGRLRGGRTAAGRGGSAA